MGPSWSPTWAERINLVGDFNNWDYESLPFQRNRGKWQVEVEVDSRHEYRFGYLLDGTHWRYDWYADKYVPNPQGGYDSIVVAEASHSSRPPGVLDDEADTCPADTCPLGLIA